MRRPIGIAIIAILNFLFGLYLILVGLGLAGAGGYNYFSKGSQDGKDAFLGIGVMGVLAFLSGLVTIIAAGALWKLKSWAWYLAFIIILYHLAQTVYAGINNGFFQPLIIHSVVYGLFALYFLAVKKHFGRSAS